MLFLNELKFKLAVEGKTIYQAVSATTRVGELLEQSELILVEIDFILPEDGITEEDNRELNRLKEIKQRKVFRYCQKAREKEAYLKLIREYDKAEYAFRFHQLGKIAVLSGREG